MVVACGVIMVIDKGIFGRIYNILEKGVWWFYLKHSKKKKEKVFTCNDNLINYKFVGTQQAKWRWDENRLENKLYDFILCMISDLMMICFCYV